MPSITKPGGTGGGPGGPRSTTTSSGGGLRFFGRDFSIRLVGTGVSTLLNVGTGGLVPPDRYWQN
jgi:hypothetical protein